MPDEPDAREALAELRRQVEAQAAELGKARAQLVRDRAHMAFGKALDDAGIWKKGRDLAIRTMMDSVENLRIDDDGDLVGSLGTVEGASPARLAEAFLRQPEFEMFLPIETEPTSAATPEAQTRRVARTRDGHPLPPGTPAYFHDKLMSELPDELLLRMSDKRPAPPERKPFTNARNRPLTELSDGELMELSENRK